MFHGLVPAAILKQYCDQHSIKEFIIPDIMTYDHPHRERSGRAILQRRILVEVNKIKAYSLKKNLRRLKKTNAFWRKGVAYPNDLHISEKPVRCRDTCT